MISDTYQPCFTAALHIATRVRRDVFIKRQPRSCADILEGKFRDEISSTSINVLCRKYLWHRPLTLSSFLLRVCLSVGLGFEPQSGSLKGKAVSGSLSGYIFPMIHCVWVCKQTNVCHKLFNMRFNSRPSSIEPVEKVIKGEALSKKKTGRWLEKPFVCHNQSGQHLVSSWCTGQYLACVTTLWGVMTCHGDN